MKAYANAKAYKTVEPVAPAATKRLCGMRCCDAADDSDVSSNDEKEADDSVTLGMSEWDSRVSEAARKREIIDRVNDYHEQRRKKAFNMSAKLFSKVIQSSSLMPITQRSELKTRIGTFEVMSTIVDSGATVPVMNPPLEGATKSFQDPPMARSMPC